VIALAAAFFTFMTCEASAAVAVLASSARIIVHVKILIEILGCRDRPGASAQGFKVVRFSRHRLVAPIVHYYDVPAPHRVRGVVFGGLSLSANRPTVGDVRRHGTYRRGAVVGWSAGGVNRQPPHVLWTRTQISS
jgi:hypothetical protein